MADTSEQEGGAGATEGTNVITPDAPPPVKLTGAAAKAAAKAVVARLAAGKPAPAGVTNAGNDEGPTSNGSARVCNQNDRAEGGMRRFKIRALNLGQRGYRYVLATDRSAAEACYLAVEGVTELPEGVARVLFATTELPD